MKNKVTASKFLDWYFRDKDDTISFGGFLIEVLKEKGRFNITAKDIFDQCGYIPSFICEDDADPSLEYTNEEVEFIDDNNIMNKKNKVTASKFIDWYFSDKDGTLSIGGFLIEVLKEKGRFSITAKDVFDRCGYVPSWLCEDDADPTLHFYDAEEVEFIDDLNPQH